MRILINILSLSFILILPLLSVPAYSEDSKDGEGGNFFEFKEHKIFYTLFSSTFIPSDIAKSYKLKRSKYQSYLNVMVNPKGQHGGISAEINGTIKNLIQQQKELKFIKIQEKNTVYYLAPIRVNGEETLHFEINAKLTTGKNLNFKFSKKLYSDL